MAFREVYHLSSDGLRLHARDYPGPAGRMPVLCLPGLTRNSKDFEDIAERLSAMRRVICPDFRGRGKSQYASDPLTYRPDMELADTLGLMESLGVARAAAIGTSRGGIVAMLMAAKAGERLAGVLFNDIGPRIETAGLLRIRTYLGADPQFTGWSEAIVALKSTNPGLDTLSEAQWLTFARRVFRDAGGSPRADYDANLAAGFPTPETIAAGKAPELWALLEFLKSVPVTVLRGEHSDLLSAETVRKMREHLPHLRAVTVPDRGHVPFLDEPESLAAIDGWLAEVDAAG